MPESTDSMFEYDFRGLSPYDFEGLVRDLLSNEWQMRLESFKTGRDKGIDLRCTTFELETIVQAKHWIESGYDRLFRHLEKEELPKIEALATKRYVLATSVPLTVGQVDNLKKLLGRVSDKVEIFGQRDLNSMLTANPQIEQAHYKLWLTSTAVLEKVLHHDLFARTERTLDAVRAKLRVYVANSSFNEAVDLLEQHHVCIVAGPPGIGKTTLADTILLRYVERGFRPVVVSGNISEADKLAYDSPTIVHYDDFLGQNSLTEKLDKNEDKDLVAFLKSSQSNPHRRVILTTREYILQQAKAVYEPLNRADWEPYKYVIELDKYTRRDRATILLNHLCFSKLDKTHIEALVRSDALHEIVDHQNFNPRVVETMTQKDDLVSSISGEYPALFLKNLNDPEAIWLHAFNDAIDQSSRIVLVALYGLEGHTSLDLLETAFHALQGGLGHEATSASHNNYLRAIRELDGSFIQIHRNRSYQVVTFQNPSVRDFVAGRIVSDQYLRRDIVRRSNFFEQLEALGNLAKRSITGETLLVSMEDEFVDGLLRTIETESGVLVRGGSNLDPYVVPKLVWIEERINWALRSAHHFPIGCLIPFVRAIVGQLRMQMAKGDMSPYVLSEVLPNLHLPLSSLSGSDLDEFFISTEWDSLVMEGFSYIGKKLTEINDFSDWESIEELIKKFKEIVPEPLITTLGALFDTYCENQENELSEEDPDDIDARANDLERIGSLLRLDVSSVSKRLRDKAQETRESTLSSPERLASPPSMTSIPGNLDNNELLEMFKAIV